MMRQAGLWGLGVLVIALTLSWIYAQFVDHEGPRTHGAAARVVRVQVLNGSGDEGAAARAASKLREGGFHVVEVGNADRQDYFATLVVARTDDDGPARQVARHLGDPALVRQAWNSDLAEVTVVLGRDRSRVRLQ
jgi:hypothetical protein